MSDFTYGCTDDGKILVDADEHRQLQARAKELEAKLAAARAGWQETIAKMASQERPTYDEQQQRIAKLEAINLGLTKTLAEMDAERAKPVEALEVMTRVFSPRNGEPGPDMHAETEAHQLATDALAAYRKQGGEA